MKTHVSVKSFLSWEFLFGKFCTPRKAFKANGVTLPRPINEVLFGLTLFLSHTHSKQVCSIHSMYVCTYLDQQHSRGKSQNVVLAKQYVLRLVCSKVKKWTINICCAISFDNGSNYPNFFPCFHVNIYKRQQSREDINGTKICFVNKVHPPSIH